MNIPLPAQIAKQMADKVNARLRFEANLTKIDTAIINRASLGKYSVTIDVSKPSLAEALQLSKHYSALGFCCITSISSQFRRLNITW